MVVVLESVIAHDCLNPRFIQQVAFGKKDLKLGGGTILTISALGRLQLREHMWKRYKKENSDAKGEMLPGTVDRNTYLLTAGIATSADAKKLGALDNISERYGRENFETLREIVRDLAAYAGGVDRWETLLTRIDKLEGESAHASAQPRRVGCLF